MTVKDSDDPVTVAMLAYEAATLRALRSLEGADHSEIVSACRDLVGTLMIVRNMPSADRESGLVLLLRRGLIPDHAWDVIGAALKLFSVSDFLAEEETHQQPTIH